MVMDDTTKKLINKHNKICEKIEKLNDEAFEIEKEIMYRTSKGEY